MLDPGIDIDAGRVASMGPRSDNRGYGEPGNYPFQPKTASMGPRSDNRGYVTFTPPLGEDGREASMGPRSDNRGYAIKLLGKKSRRTLLQWVHGQITVVMTAALHDNPEDTGFNGSTVR